MEFWQVVKENRENKRKTHYNRRLAKKRVQWLILSTAAMVGDKDNLDKLTTFVGAALLLPGLSDVPRDSDGKEMIWCLPEHIIILLSI